MAKLQNELFSPSQPTNVKTQDELLRLAPIVAKATCVEIMNENKATYKYTSKSGSKYSYDYCGDEKKIAFLGKMATNDDAESTLGGTTANIQRHGQISIASVGAMSDAKQNRLFQHGYEPE